MIADRFPSGRSRGVEPLAASQSRAAEAYRRLRTMIDLAAGERGGILLVTSPDAGAGATTVLANVGVALASADRGVLLVDGNLYRPRLHSIFGLPNDRGLTSVISGQVPLREAVQNLPDHPGVRVLTAGPPVLDPAALLSDPAAEKTFAAAANEAPVVFVDGPPLLPVTGGLVLAGFAAGVVVVARADKTSRTELAEAVDLVEQAGAPILGVVLNAVRGEHAEQSHYRDHRYLERRTPPASREPGRGPAANGRDLRSAETTMASEASLEPSRGGP